MEWGRSSCVWCTSTSLVGVDDVCVASCGLLRKKGRLGRFECFLLGAR